MDFCRHARRDQDLVAVEPTRCDGTISTGSQTQRTRPFNDAQPPGLALVRTRHAGSAAYVTDLRLGKGFRRRRAHQANKGRLMRH